jgi:hypothetical protein
LLKFAHNGRRDLRTEEDVLLFIDANKYLDLYRTVTGRDILATLSEQADHIFVTQQVVDEVIRNKINVTMLFLKDQFRNIPKAETYKVPDHLFGATETQSNNIRSQMKEIDEKIKGVNRQIRALAADIMKKVSLSTDEVSTALAPIFAKAVRPSAEHLQGAAERKRRGYPPGKPTDPIGDQVSWEQILAQFPGRKKLWVITKDTDYGCMYNDEGFFNQFLYDELRKVSPDATVFLFDNIPSAIKHFTRITGVKAEKLLTPEQINKTKREEQALPPSRGLEWTFTGLDASQAAYRRRRAYDAVVMSPISGLPFIQGGTGETN